MYSTTMRPTTTARLTQNRTPQTVNWNGFFQPFHVPTTIAAASDTVRTLGGLLGRVRSDHWTLDDGGRVDRERVAGHVDFETVEAARCGTVALLADAVVL